MAGTVVLSSQRSEGAVRWARILATADAADGSFPTKTLRALGIQIDGTILGISTNPGSTAPTDNYDIVLLDADGADRLGGVGANRDTSTTEYAAVGRVASPDDTLTLTITGNSVNNATVEVLIWWTSGVSASSISGTVSTSDSTTQTKLDTIITLLGSVLATQVWKPVGPYTATQTGTILWTPASGYKIALTHIFLTSSGTDVGLARLWFGANADTTYTAGTDQLVIEMNFGPNATADAESFPGMPLALPTPIVCANADYKLMIDTTNGLDISGVVYGYETI